MCQCTSKTLYIKQTFGHFPEGEGLKDPAMTTTKASSFTFDFVATHCSCGKRLLSRLLLDAEVNVNLN